MVQRLRQRRRGLALGFHAFGVEMLRDGSVIARRGFEHLHREFPAEHFTGVAVVFLDVVEDCAVIGRVNDHGDAGVVFRGATQHARAADVDVLDGFVQGDVRFGDGLLKGIQVHDDQIDGLDAVLGGLRFVVGISPKVQQPAMHFRVQRLDASIEHFGEAGELADFDDGYPRVLEGTRGAARGDDLDPQCVQFFCEIDQPRLVRNAYQGPLNLGHNLPRVADEWPALQSNFNSGDSARMSSQTESFLRK